MSENRSPSLGEALSLPPEEQWTLHHVLLDRLGRDAPAEPDAVPALRRAFETLDDGGRRFTLAELEAMERVLAACHHSTRWEVDRPRLEALLSRISARIERLEERRVTNAGARGASDPTRP